MATNYNKLQNQKFFDNLSDSELDDFINKSNEGYDGLNTSSPAYGNRTRNLNKAKEEKEKRAKLKESYMTDTPEKQEARKNGRLSPNSPASNMNPVERQAELDRQNKERFEQAAAQGNNTAQAALNHNNNQANQIANYGSGTMDAQGNQTAVEQGHSADVAQRANDRGAYEQAITTAQQEAEASAEREQERIARERESADVQAGRNAVNNIEGNNTEGNNTEGNNTNTQPTPETKEEVKEVIQEKGKDIEPKQKEEIIDKVAEENDTPKSAVKKVFNNFLKGIIPEGSEAFFIGQGISDMLYNLGETMDTISKNSMWSTIKSGQFKKGEYRTPFSQALQQKAAEKHTESVGNLNETRMNDQYKYNEQSQMIIDSVAGNMNDGEKAKLYSTMQMVEQGKVPSVEDYLMITDRGGEVQNVLDGRQREALCENLTNEALKLGNEEVETKLKYLNESLRLDINGKKLENEAKVLENISKHIANQSEIIKLKYLDTLQAAEARGAQISNINDMYQGSASFNAGPLGKIELPFSTVMNLANNIGCGVTELVQRAESGDSSVLNAISAAMGADGRNTADNNIVNSVNSYDGGRPQ